MATTNIDIQPRDGEDEKNKKLFVTTSDVMNHMNSVLKKMEGPDDVLAPRFELQKRLPNGNTIKADERDTAVADMESKFKQAATEVQDLTDQQKFEWAQLQRQAGNELYQQKDYKEAIDVYLTCLVVKSETTNSQFLERVFLPVMNNLAACTLHLSHFNKTVTFCTMALEESGLPNRPDLIAKLYFRRGKARRLTGEYASAEQDLEKAKVLLLEGAEAQQPTAEYRAVEKELHLVNRSVEEAEKIELKQKAAMRRLFDNPSHEEPDVETTPMYSAHRNPNSALYSDRRKRAYSTLRAKKDSGDDEETTGRRRLSYLEYYLAVVGSIAERLLVLLGDEETIQNEQDKLSKEE